MLGITHASFELILPLRFIERLVSKAFILCYIGALFCLCIVSHVHSSTLDQNQSDQLRPIYQQAKDALRENRLTRYKKLKQQLETYPLLVYLNYREGIKNLTSLSPADAQQVRNTLRGSYLYDEFHQQWLAMQYKRNRWSIYVEHFEPTDNVVAHCKYLRALHRTGNKETAMSLVEDLWMVGSSQPKECDPIFATWIETGHLSNHMVWNRFKLALENDSTMLARYLLRFFPRDEEPIARLMYDVHRKPSLVRNANRFRDTSRGREALIHGLQRYAIDEGIKARELWLQYQDRFNFDFETKQRVSSRLDFWATRKGILIETVNPAYTANSILRIADTAISQNQWPIAREWLEVYPDDLKTVYKWQYWYAITLINLGEELAGNSILEDLAKKRTYYGFLAATELDSPPQLNRLTWNENEFDNSSYLADPRISRVLELYAIHEPESAKKEWVWLFPQLNPTESLWLAAAIGEIAPPAHAIEAAFRGGASDLVDFRFPIQYVDQFSRHTDKTKIPLTMLLALTRQESAFNPKAISDVGARGLMQLMPSTARQTARNIRVPRPSLGQLFYPPVNIQIGTYHLRELLDEFDNHRVLAFAAYNAGSHRVKEWIRGTSSMNTLAWIETIPFQETRSYVKNVLAYCQVYSMLLDEPMPMLYDHELLIP